MDAAVEVGIAAFRAFARIGDGEVLAALERTGVDSWLARRLVAFLPIAFGRRMLAGVRLSPLFDDGTGGRPLAEEAVFAAAMDRSQRASREELELIGRRSAEVRAVSAALDGGARLDEVTLGPAVLAEPVGPAGSGDGGTPSPQARFRGVFAARGGRPPLSVEASVAPVMNARFVDAQVEFAVRHPALAAPVVVETFGVIGEVWRAVLGESVARFERTCLPPLVAGLVDRAAGVGEVVWDRLDHPGGSFDLCAGRPLALHAAWPGVDAGALIELVRPALAGAVLSRAVHAVRLSACRDDGDLLSVEALLDGAMWPGGSERLHGLAGPAVGLCGFRWFLLAIPDQA